MERRALGDEAFGGLFAPAVSEAGIYVTPDTALRVATVFACVRVLSESIAIEPPATGLSTTTAVTLEPRADGSGKIVVEYGSEEELTRLVEVLKRSRHS